MSQTYNDNLKRPKLQNAQLGILKICTFCLKIQQMALGPGERAAWLMQYVFENKPKNFVVQGRTQLEHSVTQLRSVPKLHGNPLIHDLYWRKQPNWQAHLELCHMNPDILEQVLKQIPLSNSIAGKWAHMQVIKQTEHGRISNRGTKMILLSDEPWLIANNSKSFVNGSKSIIRNKLSLCKHSQIYLI